MRDTLKKIWSTVYRPVPIFVLGLFPIILKGTHIANALMLCLAFILSSFTVTALSLVVPRFAVKSLRPVIYASAGAFVVCAAGLILTKIAVLDMYKLGAVLPLAAMDPLIVTGLVGQTEKENAKQKFISAAVYSACFCALTIMVSVIREFLYTGSIFGLTLLDESHRFFSAEIPFFGIILLAMIAAALSWAENKIKERRSAKGGIQL